MKCIYYGDCQFNRMECQEDNPFYSCPDRKVTVKFKVTTYKIKTGICQGWFDCQIWMDGVIIQSASGTAFETKEKAKEYGDYLVSEAKKLQKIVDNVKDVC